MMIKAIVSFFGHFFLFLQILIHMLEIEQKMCYNKLILLSHSNALPDLLCTSENFGKYGKIPLICGFSAFAARN